MPPLRLCYVGASVGFAASAVGSAMGAAPTWPNDWTWTIVAGLAAVALAVYAVRLTAWSLHLATSAVVVAGAARVLGWVLSTPRIGTLLSAAGVWLIVVSLMFVVHYKASKLRHR